MRYAVVPVLAILFAACGTPPPPGAVEIAEGRYRDAEEVLKPLIQNIISSDISPLAAARVLQDLGYAYAKQDKTDEALATYDRALKLLEDNGLTASIEMARGLTFLASLQSDLGQNDEAAQNFGRAVELFRRHGDDHSLDMAMALNGLGVAYALSGRVGEAEQYFREAMPLLREHRKGNELKIARGITNFASYLLQTGKIEEARPLFNDVMQGLLAKELTATVEMADALNGAAYFLYLDKDYEGARLHMEKAVDVLVGVRGQDHPSVAKMLHDLARVYQGVRKYSEAEKAYKRSIEIYEAKEDANHEHLLLVLQSYAEFLREQNRAEEAAAVEQRIAALKEKDMAADAENTRN